MKSPLIDKRSSKDILDKIKKIKPFYLPEWNQTEGEPGWAIAQLFCDMSEDVIERLNKVPENLFLDFLDRLGFKLLPPTPSKAPVVFQLVKNKKENITVKKGTRLSSGDGTIFETAETLTITPSKLEKIYSTDPEKDVISEHFNGMPSYLFKENIQKHYFYTGDDYLFKLYRAKGTGLNVYMIPPFNGDWEYFSGYDEKGNEIWKKFKKVEKIIQREPSKEDIKKADLIKLKFRKLKTETEKLKLLKEFQKLVEGLRTKEIRYYKIDTAPIHKNKINGVDTFWLRVKLDKNYQDINVENRFKIYGISGIDSLFYNDIPLSIDDLISGKEVLPFGKEPKIGDSFYISSDEAFSKRKGEIKIEFQFKTDSYFSRYGKDGKKTYISWEYWNGNSWKSLKYTIEYTEDKKEKFEFLCPEDISKIEVNGESHFWIRGRITASSYGGYKVENNQVIPEFFPPEIKKIKIEFGIEKTPDINFTYNNLEFEKIGKTLNKLFKPLPDKNKSVYLGFDSEFGEGDFSIFFSIKNPNWNENKYLMWKYWDGEKWKSFPVEDRTENLKKSGIFKFISPKDIAKTKRFGKDLYWLKLEIIEKTFKEDIEKREIVHSKKKTDNKNCTKKIDVLKNLLKHLNSKEQIQLNGIYLNTVYADRQETVNNEILGSSDGSPNQIFRLKRTPVIEVEIWVKEQVKPKEEIEFFEENNYFWVRWKEVEDLDFSCETCRHYQIDKVSGEIKFGDGLKGKIPPKGKDNIKANYKTGGGTGGNLPVKSITNLVSSIPYIDKVFNVEPSSGGSEPEKQTDVLERAPKTLRHRNRGINLFDYENITKEISTEIAKLKIIPNLNSKGQYQTGWITVVILPYSEEGKIEVPRGLLKHIESSLKKKIPVTVRLQVIPPVYGKIEVDLKATTRDFSKFSEIKNSLTEKITEFLNPLKGGTDKTGWDFGQVPCFSDFFTVINSVDGIENIKELKIYLKVNGTTVPITPDRTKAIEIPPYLLIVAGEIKISIEGV